MMIIAPSDLACVTLRKEKTEYRQVNGINLFEELRIKAKVTWGFLYPHFVFDSGLTTPTYGRFLYSSW